MSVSVSVFVLHVCVCVCLCVYRLPQEVSTAAWGVERKALRQELEQHRAHVHDISAARLQLQQETEAGARVLRAHAQVSYSMLTYADVCCRMLTYADVC